MSAQQQAWLVRLDRIVHAFEDYYWLLLLLLWEGRLLVVTTGTGLTDVGGFDELTFWRTTINVLVRSLRWGHKQWASSSCLLALVV